jgi:hypothetical protein
MNFKLRIAKFLICLTVNYNAQSLRPIEVYFVVNEHKSVKKP